MGLVLLPGHHPQLSGVSMGQFGLEYLCKKEGQSTAET